MSLEMVNLPRFASPKSMLYWLRFLWCTLDVRHHRLSVAIGHHEKVMPSRVMLVILGCSVLSRSKGGSVMIVLDDHGPSRPLRRGWRSLTCFALGLSTYEFSLTACSTVRFVKQILSTRLAFFFRTEGAEVPQYSIIRGGTLTYAGVI